MLVTDFGLARSAGSLQVAAIPLLERALAIAAKKTVDAENAAEATDLLAKLRR